MFARHPPAIWIGGVLLIALGWEAAFHVELFNTLIRLDYVTLSWGAPMVAAWLGCLFGRKAYLSLLMAAPVLLMSYQWEYTNWSPFISAGASANTLFAYVLGYPSLQAAAIIAAMVTFSEFRNDEPARTAVFWPAASLVAAVLLGSLSLGLRSQSEVETHFEALDLSLGLFQAPLFLGLAGVATGLIALRSGLWAALALFVFTVPNVVLQSFLEAFEVDISLNPLVDWWVSDLVRVSILFGLVPVSAIMLAAGALAGHAVRPLLAWLKGARPAPAIRFGAMAGAVAIAFPGLLAYQGATSLMQFGFLTAVDMGYFDRHFSWGRQPVPVPPPPPPPVAETQRINAATIYFSFAGAETDSMALAVLQEFAALKSGGRLFVLGHADRAEAAQGLAFELSYRRAQSVALALQPLLPGTKIRIGGAGDRAPAVRTDEHVREALNRRAEIWFEAAADSLAPANEGAESNAATTPEPPPETVIVTVQRVRFDQSDKALLAGALLLVVFSFALSAVHPRRAAFPTVALLLAIFAISQASVSAARELFGDIGLSNLSDAMAEWMDESLSYFAAWTILFWIYAYAGAGIALRVRLFQSQARLSL